MNIALLGNGKTGSKVFQLAREKHQVEVFDTKHAPTYERLKNADVVISFLPGEAFEKLIPLLVETRLPVVTGSTGLKWPENIESILKEKNLAWIYGTNFSLGIVVIKQLIHKLQEMEALFEKTSVSIHEIHHTKKIDSPSGTAISMNEWSGGTARLTSERTGDVIGYHVLTVDTGREEIKLSHEAKDRALFAEGALWAAHALITHQLDSGLHSFQSVAETQLSL